MAQKAIQDWYPDHLNHCYGCGSLNPHGLGIRSYWQGDRAVATFTPHPFHLGPPGYVYGGLLASLVDCHANATACAAAYQAAGREPGSEPLLRFMTAALRIDYLRPTPIDGVLELEGRVREATPRKAVVEVTIVVAGELCVRGEVVSVLAPERFLRPPP
ncbi:MAG: PaaI family thioesterase [Desulfobulbaceae bacterium]|nr:PaaI family thioesterase [Desulfobulbaceae bacterium]